MQNFLNKAPHILHKNIPKEFDLDQVSDHGDDWPMDGIQFRQAAVLVAVIDQKNPSIILTRRPLHMKKHAGQIAFPGGKLEPSDQDATFAAMREAHEEIGLDPQYVDVLGCLDVYKIGSGYKICPVVAKVNQGFVLKADPNEVAEIFELPLDFLMTEDNYKLESKFWRGKSRQFYVLEYENYFIWGATAGMLKNLADKLRD
ncbi:MAG: CoA pyrophosphatase [OCS116 cluster bacterium]|uniref:CoA pyrophosphatase n=1 Tax=OCS116 cluster bacterium TaxID=2030921 RepID=A0A2A4YPF5_9PROT|nr:CoA pyrophosphatase [OCS116 cluster bacterium]